MQVVEYWEKGILSTCLARQFLNIVNKEHAYSLDKMGFTHPGITIQKERIEIGLIGIITYKLSYGKRQLIAVAYTIIFKIIYGVKLRFDFFIYNSVTHRIGRLGDLAADGILQRHTGRRACKSNGRGRIVSHYIICILYFDAGSVYFAQRATQYIIETVLVLAYEILRRDTYGHFAIVETQRFRIAKPYVKQFRRHIVPDD